MKKYPFSDILVTGGLGFIGSHFIEAILSLKQDINITSIDKVGYATSLKTKKFLEDICNFKSIKGDILDRDMLQDIFGRQKFDCVIHFAAESHVDNSISEPNDFIFSNIVGTYNLLEAIRNSKFPEKVFFHHISTDEVYGSLSASAPPFLETNKYEPSSPYSASKAASDLLVESWYKTFGMNYLITNCSNNFGPRQFTEKLIPKVIINAFKKERIPIYGDGLNVRDWIYVKDHINALIALHINSVSNTTVNIGGNNEINNLEITNNVLKIISSDTGNDKLFDLIEFVQDRPGHDFRYSIDSTKIFDLIGWEPSKDFIKNLIETVSWYNKNSDWWDS